MSTTTIPRTYATAILLTSIGVLAAVDLIADLGDGTTLGHVVLEGAAASLALLGAGWIVRANLALVRETRALRHDAAASRVEAQRWRDEAQELIGGLGAAIDRQLDAWALTAAEKEVSLLLLKGLSHKQIAEVRGVNENTVRQQAHAIYRKAGLEGRHDLAAFFLEDLLGPRR